jgi:N-acetylmuramic acid 6-phosphate etherase
MQTEERNPNTYGLDRMSAYEIAARMNVEDQTVPLVVARALPQIAAAIEIIAAALRAGGRLIYVGAGASGRTAVMDAVECVPTFNMPPDRVLALLAGGESAFTRSLELAEDDADQGRQDLIERNAGRGDVVVGIAASGRTPYVLGALAHARAAGCTTIGIASSAPSPLLEQVDLAIPLVTGPEVIAGSTRLKAGTAQKLVLNMLSTGAMIRLGKVYSNLMVDVQAGNSKLLDRAARIVARVGGVEMARALELLDLADRETKTAIVMARLGLDAPAARARLAEADGFLRTVIGDVDVDA